MRILQLLSQTQPTGAETYALTLSDWLTGQGHEVLIASDRLHSETRQRYLPLAVHDSRLKTRIQSTRYLRTFLRENKIQVIHCHSRAAARLAYWATLGTSVATVSTLHGRQPVSLSKRLHDIYGQKCISICENLTEQVTQTLGMEARKIRLIRNPIAVQSLAFTETLRKENKMAWIGRFTGPKGERAQQFLQQVVQGLLERHADLSIDLIGGDPSLLGEATVAQVQLLQTRFPGRLAVLNHRPKLDEELQNYRLILAAGRIAMSSLAKGIPTFAIGEYSSEGLVTRTTLSAALASNFGDIGPEGAAMSPVNFPAMARALEELVSGARVLALEERQHLREQVISQFGLDGVCAKILNVYKSAYFLRNSPASVPVLMYHKIPKSEIQTKHRIFVTAENFEKHLQFYQAQGFTTLHFADLEEFRSGRRDFSEFPKRPLLLTFDDGYVDNLENAGPALQKYQMKAVIYLLADHSLQSNAWDHDGEETSHALMTLEQKKQLTKFGFEIGSHGFRHEKITTMSEAEARTELAQSKKQLESDLQTTVLSYAYTYGVTSPRAAELAEEAGYSFAVNTDSGGLHLEENPYAIFRANIFPEDGPAQLRKKTASWYRRYFYFKRGR